MVRKSIVAILGLLFAMDTGQMFGQIIGSKVKAQAVVEQDVGGTKYMIVVGTTTDHNGIDKAIVLRYTNTGILDTNFGGSSTGYIIPTLPTNGTSSRAKAVVVNSDGTGTILVAGSVKINGVSQVAVMKLNSNGTLVSGFGASGWAMLSYEEYAGAESIVSYTDGSCAIAGSTMVTGRSKILVARFTNTGLLETSFNGTGYYINDETGTHSRATSLVKDSSNNLYVAGSGGGAEQFVILKLDSSGAKVWLRKTAIGSYARASDVKIGLDSSSIIVAGTSTKNNVSSCTLAKYNMDDGSLVTSFGNMSPTNGIALFSVENFPSLRCNALEIKSEGTLYVVCTAYGDNVSVGLACKTDDTGSSMSEPVNPIRVGTTCELNDLMIDSSGNIVCCGLVDTSILLCRYNASGFDGTFGNNGFVYDPYGMDAPAGSIAYLWEEQTQNSNSSDASASSGNPRTLNKIAGDGGFVSLGSDNKNFNLKPGTYDITVRAPADCKASGTFIYAHQIQLMQENNLVASGTSEYVSSKIGSDNYQQMNTWSMIQTRVTIDKGQGSLAYSIKHNYSGALVSLGSAANLGPEIYTQVKIVKIR